MNNHGKLQRYFSAVLVLVFLAKSWTACNGFSGEALSKASQHHSKAHSQHQQHHKLRLTRAVRVGHHQCNSYVHSPCWKEDQRVCPRCSIKNYFAIGQGRPLPGLYSNPSENAGEIDCHKGWLDYVISRHFRKDLHARSSVYLSDWIDGFKDLKHCIPATLFLYFACLAPVVSFGTISALITDGSIGIVEYIISSGMSGMVYSLICGQPMAFIAPTGLTLAFIGGLFKLCTLKSLPFMPIYSCVGLWTGAFFIVSGLGGAGSLIRYCTPFTDEIFNALLSVNFIYEGFSSLRRNFVEADPSNLTMPFVSLTICLSTWFLTTRSAAFEYSRYFSQKVRTFIKNFGPSSVFVIMSILNQQPFIKNIGVRTLAVPESLRLAGNRSFLVSLSALPFYTKLLCAFPAVFLCGLFFMDHNISVLVVNKPENKLKKSTAYNLDMVALGLVTLGLSLTGLPWMCGATVQSLSHVRALTEMRFNAQTGEPEKTRVTETRLTGFMVHALILATLRLLPLLGFLPIPVVSGVFIFLGCKLMSGNSFLHRILDVFVERKRLKDSLLLDKHPILTIGRPKTAAFTALQFFCLVGLWFFKQNDNTTIFFPSAIGFLMIIRGFILPKLFTEAELTALGDPTPTKGRKSWHGGALD